ncbi:unnamed protein product [Zymoseptoria tritici ST99CH_1A5]|uniref:Condensation domain-containing protein n=1 Tax=Zymoseptoria tritici ST99CH_1A5 TaxID=1276529 RepID=A0A1Y6L6A8_ZYMTR|nr:unnamed protein product [Zymoseptoria tritici ST99CH_1A5]
MSVSTHPPDWLRRYGNLQGYSWRPTTINGRSAFCRPLGLVEFSFDTDGRHYEGRADMNVCIKTELATTLSKADLRERILLAWTRLRNQHLLLRAKTIRDESDSLAPQGLHFAVTVPESWQQARIEAEKQIVWLEDHYENIEWKDFSHHCQNVKRVVDPDVALAKVFVLPTENADGKRIQRFQFVGGHQIWDGLSSYVWMRDFVHCLNETSSNLQDQITTYIQPESIRQHLPLPQEALYPPIQGNIARQRWFWAITRILRHVRTPLPAGFENPLRQEGGVRKQAIRFEQKYAAVLDYSAVPPLNTTTLHVAIPSSSAKHLSALCRSTSTTLGAGIFALAALTMMEAHENSSSSSFSPQDRPFITGFPLNPRAFFNHHTDPNSMMLAFSDGISLPSLPSSLPFASRLRLLTRLAHRQLTSYQKRARPIGDAAKRQNLTSRGAGLVLANQYLYSLERCAAVLPTENRAFEGGSVQGAYPARPNSTTQTCGVSSVGRRDAIIGKGMYDVESIVKQQGKDLVVDFRDMTASVRAREGEFLVGIGGAEGGLFAAVSIDGSVMDEGKVEAWKRRFETCLEELGRDGGMARL